MADTTEQLKDTVSNNDGGSLSKEKILPALATAAAAAAAGLAATKGPDLLKKIMGEADDQAEELGGKAADGAKQQLGSSGGPAGQAASTLVGGATQKGGKTRRLPIQRWTDVAVPIDKAYAAWTNFEKYPQFMHRVLSVQKSNDGKDEVQWEEKIWFSKRQWKGKVVERRKNDRIAWKTTSGTSHSGIVSFHKLDENLTRVMVEVDFQPTGLFEKMGSGLRFVKRAVQADLARFKAYVEMKDVKGLDYSPEKGNDGDDDDKDKKDDKESRAQASNGHSKSS